MKKILVVLALGVALCGCQKQQSEEERRVEVEREVQRRLAAEQQQHQKQELEQREAQLTAREQALNQQSTPGRESAVPERVRGAATERESPSSYTMFYTKLEQYGDWIETDDYGYVYRPREATSGQWRPYTNGHWIYTDAGWTWISEEPFGWATYHYGRWTRLRGVGWVWVPGDEWAPAWVSWRKGGDYVGWAPLPPEAQFDRRSGIHNWSDSYYGVGPDQYVFVPARQFGELRVDRAIVPEERNLTIVNLTTNVTNITYGSTTIVNEGPGYDELGAQSAQPIARLRLQRQMRLGDENPRAVVRGEVIEIPAPVITRQRVERPPAVKQTVRQAAIDLGWAAIGNQREAEVVRAKMKSEATPPPNAPSKKFVKAAEASVANTSVQSAPVSAATPTPKSRPTPTLRPARTSTPDASATQTPTATTIQSTHGEAVTSRPSIPPTPTQSTTPFSSRTPTTSATSSATTIPSATSPPQLSPLAKATPTPRGTAQVTPALREQPPASVSASATASGPLTKQLPASSSPPLRKSVLPNISPAGARSPTPSSSPSPSQPQSSEGTSDEERKARRDGKHHHSDPAKQPSASPSATAEAPGG